MKPMSRKDIAVSARWFALFGVVMLALLSASTVEAFTLNVQGPAAGAQYRWLLQEDRTYHPDTTALNPNDPNVLGLNFHRSSMPVVKKGNASGPVSITVPDPAKWYFVSVLPMEEGTYTLGGAMVKPGATDVTVYLNQLPIPTAQISVFVFEDNNRINGVPDLPQELGLEGFIVNITDAGGRFGVSGGLISQDAFGNPLGTTYNPDGSVNTLGDGVIRTNANGVAVIKYLYPAKYGITVSPPLGGPVWHQTSTIEGTPTIDAWVKADEPPYFTEFGPAGHHCDFGFVKEMNDATVLNGAYSISGKVVSTHMSRPPNYNFYPGAAFPATWIGLNDAGGKGVYAKPANPDSTFTIPNVPPGNYQVVIWNEPLDVVIASTLVNVVNSDVNLGDVGVFDWFAHLQGTVFFDRNRNGFRDCVTPACSDVFVDDYGMSGQVVNIRWRDGSLYQTTSTGADGGYEFAEVFPFFHWLVAEVDFTRYKPTGVTAVVDAGGMVDTATETFPGFGKLNPQPQAAVNPNTGDNLSRTQKGAVLTQAFQAFLGQTNVIDWGKNEYFPLQNGGISGMVFYDTTRAENNPELNAGEPWQPGIAGVTVNLYDSTGATLLQTVQTDNWDDGLPTKCPGDPTDVFYKNGKCYDGLRNFNQVRPGVYDGGYAFEGLDVGEYIVEVVPPPGYEVVGPEDKNVDFGDTRKPSPMALPASCAGTSTPVPQYLSLFPNSNVLHPYYDPDSPVFVRAYDPGNPVMLPACNRKRVQVVAKRNAAADFFLFTQVPIAGQVVGMILNDLGNEFDPSNPNFGEKFAPSWLPVSFSDYTGREIVRVYTDQYGRYNAMVPSTYSANVPSPSGVAPNMLIACMNDPGPIPDPANPGQFIIDPLFQRQFTQFCYTFQYMPGVTTYLDTPVLPIAAFAGQNQTPLDCEFDDGTPVIFTVSAPNGMGGGPVMPTKAGGVITITAMGPTQVLNPGYGPDDPNKFITRDYGFGTTQGRVTLGGAQLAIQSWSAGVVKAIVPPNASTGEIALRRGDNNKWTEMNVTLTVGLNPGQTVWRATPKTDPLATPISNNIAKASPGDIVLVAPGVYSELVVMDRDVALQGWGAPSVTINAVKKPGEKLQLWRNRVNAIVAAPGTQYLLPGQVANFDPANNEPGLFNTAEGPGIMVLADRLSWQKGAPPPRIDGFTITGSDIGGAIVVNGYAKNLRITNNRLISNQGAMAGGIRVGDPRLVDGAGEPVDALNDNMRIMHNHITQNGCTDADGAGGIGLFSGTNGYEVSENYICGNFSTGSGGGVEHFGLSVGKAKTNLIARNKIIFNQSFNQMPGMVNQGGGIAIRGLVPAAGGLTLGSGSVTIDRNLIQGNLAGAGDGGGIALAHVNGADVQANPGDPNTWHKVGVFNNMIMNNVAGLAGGGMSLIDTLGASIVHNSISYNDSSATAGDAFASGSLLPSTPQPAGLISRRHSPSLAAVIGNGYSRPTLFNDVIYHNRSFYWDATITNPQGIAVGGLLPNPAGLYQDLGVLGANGKQQPNYCILTDATGYFANNIAADPAFVKFYFNGNSMLPIQPENTTPLTAAAVDEGGNFIDLKFLPLTLRVPGTGALYGDHHILAGSPAVNAGNASIVGQYPELAKDYDGNSRPVGRPDIGAVERR